MPLRKCHSRPADPPRQFKPVGLQNRGKNLAGRFDPDDVPIITQTVEEEIAQDFQEASKWARAHSQLNFEKPSDFTLREETIVVEEGESENFDPYQFRRQPIDSTEVFNISNELGIPTKKGGRTSIGVSTGELSEAPPTHDIPRLKTQETWWAFQQDTARELIDEIRASKDWPAGSADRAGYIIVYYFLQRFTDKEIAEELPDMFSSANACKKFRQGLVKFASKMFARDPDTPMKSGREYWDSLPDLPEPKHYPRTINGSYGSTMAVGNRK